MIFWHIGNGYQKPLDHGQGERLTELSRSAKRVQEALAARGVGWRVMELPASTRSAPEAAAAVGCQVADIAKSVVFHCIDEDRPVLAVICGADRVDESKLAGVAGGTVAPAKPDFIKRRLGFAIGGVPPLGHLEAVQTYVDRRLLRRERIWAAAGTPHAVFCLTPRELIALTDALVADVVVNSP